MEQKIGIGYDIHRLVERKKLILGGVEIPFIKGLEGHSDADVVLHSICDAILGALGKGDIGEHFPDNDDTYKGMSSSLLLSKVGNIMEENKFSVGNMDVVIQAEEPNLTQYKSEMCLNIANVLKIDKEKVNIKATTMEKLGPIGRKEGIATFSTVLLIKN